jgi:hypothetical protein
MRGTGRIAKKNAQGRGPAPKTYMDEAKFLCFERDGCGFAPACPPKTWTARSTAPEIAQRFDLAHFNAS